MCEDKSIFRYLCPSLLGERDLREELKKKCPQIKGLEGKTREELTQIFTKHVLPLPQRTFPSNNHGRIINKMIQIEDNSSRRKSETEANSSCRSLQYGFSESNVVSRSSPHLGQERTMKRLKPPVDLSNVHNKKICLSQTPSSSSSLGRVIIKDRSKDKERNDTESDRRSSIEKVSHTERLQLKRKRSESENEAVPPTKKAIQRIAWP